MNAAVPANATIGYVGASEPGETAMTDNRRPSFRVALDDDGQAIEAAVGKITTGIIAGAMIGRQSMPDRAAAI